MRWRYFTEEEAEKDSKTHRRESDKMKMGNISERNIIISSFSTSSVTPSCGTQYPFDSYSLMQFFASLNQQKQTESHAETFGS